MNNAKFTPGPWKYDPAAETVTSADLSMVVYEMNTNEADGNLIAAAPDLYEALKDVQWSGEPAGRCPQCCNWLREHKENCLIGKALAKAEGR